MTGKATLSAKITWPNPTATTELTYGQRHLSSYRRAGSFSESPARKRDVHQFGTAAPFHARRAARGDHNRWGSRDQRPTRPRLPASRDGKAGGAPHLPSNYRFDGPAGLSGRHDQ